jgi:uncharacterized protein YjiS (DUF1127 family)
MLQISSSRLEQVVRGAETGEFLASVAANVTGVFQRLVDAFVRWERRAQTIAHLEGLNDRCLADFGLERHEIAGFVDGQRTRERGNDTAF